MAADSDDVVAGAAGTEEDAVATGGEEFRDDAPGARVLMEYVQAGVGLSPTGGVWCMVDYQG